MQRVAKSCAKKRKENRENGAASGGRMPKIVFQSLLSRSLLATLDRGRENLLVVLGFPKAPKGEDGSNGRGLCHFGLGFFIWVLGLGSQHSKLGYCDSVVGKRE